MQNAPAHPACGAGGCSGVEGLNPSVIGVGEGLNPAVVGVVEGSGMCCSRSSFPGTISRSTTISGASSTDTTRSLISGSSKISRSSKNENGCTSYPHALRTMNSVPSHFPVPASVRMDLCHSSVCRWCRRGDVSCSEAPTQPFPFCIDAPAAATCWGRGGVTTRSGGASHGTRCCHSDRECWWGWRQGLQRSSRR